MEKLPYLKDQLQTNIPKLVTIAKRVGQYPETDYVTKKPTGKMQTLYHFHLPDGPTVRHYAKEREEEVLMHFQPGETVQVVRQEKVGDDGKRFSFLVWTPADGAEARAAAAPSMHTNTHLAKEAKKLEERQYNENEKWAKKDIAQTLGMLTKLFFDSRRSDTPVDVETRFDWALDLAGKNRMKFAKKIDDCYIEDFVTPKKSDFAPEPIHTPSVSASDLPF